MRAGGEAQFPGCWCGADCVPASVSWQCWRISRVVIWAFCRVFDCRKRASWTARAAITWSRIAALVVPSLLAAQLLERHGRHFDVQVDAVEQRAADLGHVALDLRDRAVAFAARVVAVAARARIERRDEHEIGGEGRASSVRG